MGSRDTAPEDSDAFKATKVVGAEANPYLRDDTVAFGPCLPAELCCMIMSMVNLADRLSMSRVCSSWRTAALSNPLLWTRLDSVNLRTRGATFVRLLSRSNDLPLQISVDMLHLVFDLQKRRVDNWMPLARHIVHALRQHMHRVVDLRIWCRLDTASQLFNGTSVPVLRTLDISFASTAALPHHWLNRWAPELQCLRLTNAVLPISLRIAQIRRCCPKLQLLILDYSNLAVDDMELFYSESQTLFTEAPLPHLSIDGPGWLLEILLPQLPQADHLQVLSPDPEEEIVPALFHPLFPSSAPSALYLVQDRHGRRVLDARVGHKRRTVVFKHDRYDVRTICMLDILNAIFADDLVMRHLVHLTLFDCDWDYQVPGDAPSLQYLCVVLDSRQADSTRRLFFDENIFTWACPSLATICIGDTSPSFAENRGGRWIPCSLGASRVVRFLGEMLSFGPDRRLETLQFKNVRLVDDSELPRELGVASSIPNDFLDALVREIVTADDEDWTVRAAGMDAPLSLPDFGDMYDRCPCL